MSQCRVVRGLTFNLRSGAKRQYAYGPADPISGDSVHHDEGQSTPKRQRNTYGDHSDEGEGSRNWEPRSQYGDRQVRNP
jgi:hypothetical protein